MIIYDEIPDYVPENVREHFKDIDYKIPFYEKTEFHDDEEKIKFNKLQKKIKNKYGYNTDDLLEFKRKEIRIKLTDLSLNLYKDSNYKDNSFNLSEILNQINKIQNFINENNNKYIRFEIDPRIGDFNINTYDDYDENIYTNSFPFYLLFNSFEINIYGIRLENDEEYNKRINYNIKKNETEKDFKNNKKKIQEIRTTPEQMEICIKRAEEVVRNSASWKDVKPQKK